jgi:glycosyltransferase involved in cell wall biosynthesis
LAPHLSSRGIKLEVAYLNERGDGIRSQLESFGIQVFSLAGTGGQAGRMRRARTLILHRQPQLVHTTLFRADMVGRVAARIAGVPSVSSLVNDSYGPGHRSDPSLRASKLRAAQMADALTARWVTRFHALTAFIADVMAQRLRVSRDRIDVIPRGRDQDRLGSRTAERRRVIRAELGIDDGTPLVLAAARHEYQKGLDLLLRAFPQVLRARPDALLVLAGREGDATPALNAIVTALGLARSVRFLGVRDDVPDLLTGADVFVMPSRWEGFGGTLLEAMALETPIVAHDLPPIREVLEDGSMAVLVPLGNVEALARAMVASLQDREATRLRTARANERFLERFTVDRVADQTAAFYGRALMEARRNRARPEARVPA